MLWYCNGCTAAYAVGLNHCPQCGQSSEKPSDVPAEQPQAKRQPKGKQTDDHSTAKS